MSALPPTLIVGLGNPGAKYENTRHNVGFKVIEALAERVRVETREHRFSSELWSVRFAGRRIRLLKPQTFMNDSGAAVTAACNALGCSPGETLIIYDCMDLPVGRIRIRTGGGSGGHKGLQSVIDCLQTRAVPRLRVGIGRPPDPRQGVDYVLSPWSPEENPAMQAAIQTAADAVLTAARQGLERAMNRFNTWQYAAEGSKEETTTAGKENNGDTPQSTAAPRKETDS